MSKPAKAKAPEGAEPPKKGGKKKLVLIALVLLLGGGGAGAWFSGFIPKLLGRDGEAHAAAEGAEHGEHGEKPAKHGEKAAPAHGAKSEAHAEATGPLFMDLPDIVANLNAGPRRAAFVKLKAKLELSKPEDQAALQAALPRVLDLFQGYLRETRPEELRGSAGTYRLREELMARTNLAAPPARVVAVLFTEILVQ